MQFVQVDVYCAASLALSCLKWCHSVSRWTSYWHMRANAKEAAPLLSSAGWRKDETRPLGWSLLLHCWHGMQGRVYVTVEHPSICPSLCLSICPIIWPLHAAVADLLLWARRPGDTDRLLHGWRSAVNVSSVMLSADVGSWTQSCYTCKDF